jgi:Fur family transcriptional regulator, ferric uptake regulator
MGPADMSRSWTTATLDALRERGYRAGVARRAVVELLGSQECCLTAQEVYDRLRTSGRGVGMASVYRVLDQLAADGYVQRVELGEGIARYEPHHRDGQHHHHLVCEECGKIEAFADDELERAIRKLGRRTGYAVAGHDVLLRGACRECAPAR